MNYYYYYYFWKEETYFRYIYIFLEASLITLKETTAKGFTHPLSSSYPGKEAGLQNVQIQYWPCENAVGVCTIEPSNLSNTRLKTIIITNLSILNDALNEIIINFVEIFK